MWMSTFGERFMKKLQSIEKDGHLSPFEKFKQATKKVLSMSKKELDERLAEKKEANTKASR